MAWRADTSNLTPHYPDGARPAVAFAPDSGVTPVGEAAEVEVTFTPQEAREYVIMVPLFLEGAAAADNDGAPYLELELKGKGVPPSLAFDRRELVLPPVPLGATVQGTIYVINNGYDHCELKFGVPANEITTAVSVPLRVTLPDGEAVLTAKGRLPVVVEINADKPIAFTSLIEFSDGDGERYSISVTGVSAAAS